MPGKFIWGAASKDKYITTIYSNLAIARLGEFMANINTKHYSDVNSAVETRTIFWYIGGIC